jgi:hypothetical protein
MSFTASRLSGLTSACLLTAAATCGQHWTVTAPLYPLRPGNATWHPLTIAGLASTPIVAGWTITSLVVASAKPCTESVRSGCSLSTLSVFNTL